MSTRQPPSAGVDVSTPFRDLVKDGRLLFPAEIASYSQAGNCFADSLFDLPLPERYRDAASRRYRFFISREHVGQDAPLPGDFVLVEWKDAGTHPSKNPLGVICGVTTRTDAFARRAALESLQQLADALPSAGIDTDAPERLLHLLQDEHSSTELVPVLARWLENAITRARHALGERSAALDVRMRELDTIRRATEPARAFADALGIHQGDDRGSASPTGSLPTLDEIERPLSGLASPLVIRAALIATLTAALTGSLVLLDGPVGTGKTTLAERIARTLGGREHVIPVRPAWVEPADLLGFYDPLSRVFRPGPLTEGLANAAEDRLFALVLDELNLARIENYGADLLSRIERLGSARWRARDPQGIPAWSKSEWRALKDEWELLDALAERKPEQAHRLAQLRATLRHLPELPVPDGTVLIGTLNTDDTTFDLSPKVIDRSFALAFPLAQLDARAEESTAEFPLSVTALRVAAKARCDAGIGDALWQAVRGVAAPEKMALVGVPYSHRFLNDLRTFAAVAEVLGATDADVLRMFLFARVLPRIRFFKSDQSTQTALTLLAAIKNGANPENDPAWNSVIQRLEQQCHDDQATVVRFWRGDLS